MFRPFRFWDATELFVGFVLGCAVLLIILSPFVPPLSRAMKRSVPGPLSVLAKVVLGFLTLLAVIGLKSC